MNRKKQSKVTKQNVINEMAKETLEADRKKVSVHPFNDEVSWVGRRWKTPPWTDAQIADYQKKINSAFGAEDAFILAWSGDERYWDRFYEEWYTLGYLELPKGELKPKPILLWGQFNLNAEDYLYIFPPRWLILEKLHPSEYANGWEEASWVDTGLGTKRRVRSETPPPAMYSILQTIAHHEMPTITGDKPPCCRRWLERDSPRICYGEYRPPSDKELAMLRNMREEMDRDGVAQRNDEARSEKVLRKAAASTQHYIKSAAMAQTLSVNQMIAENPQLYLGDMIERAGLTSAREIDGWVAKGLERATQNKAQEIGI